jgi:protein tyrosine phosphatase (PTP) superfamily phosphohydrolase (DUF442 family)
MPSKSYKDLKRTFRKHITNARAYISETTPEPVRRWAGPWVGYADMLLLDHLFVRVLFPNRHRLADRAWRAAQPLPYQLRKVKSLGVRTVVNLRGGGRKNPTARREQAACERLGLNYVEFKLRSRDAPSKDELYGLRELFANVEHPILFHCKSGADRAGLASVLYLHLVEHVPIEKARDQLSLRYGHIKQADTGVLDAFFERYLADNAKSSVDFYTWVDTTYDPVALKQSYRSRGWANRIVDGLLRRE